MSLINRLLLLLLACAAPLPATPSDLPLKVGLIGLDTSHVIAFTGLLNDKDNPSHVPGATVTAAYRGGSVDIPASINRVRGFTTTLTEKYGVRIYEDIAKMCEEVDAILLTSLDGRTHLEQVRPVLAAGKPVFIDKPVAGSLKDAVKIFQLAEDAGVPCFSSSSLRWYPGVIEVATADFGELRAALSYGPATSEPHHPSLFWYGIHAAEALFTVMGPGCQSVVATESSGAIVVTGKWNNERIGTLHGIRDGKTSFKVTAFGTKAIVEQKSGGNYAPMLREIVKFFQTGKPPVPAKLTLELYAFMEAADESVRQGGTPISIPDYLRRHGQTR